MSRLPRTRTLRCEQRPHLGGALATAVLKMALRRKRVVQDLDSRALETRAGAAASCDRGSTWISGDRLWLYGGKQRERC